MPDGLGNQTQVRVIAEQLFDIWDEKQGKRTASWPAWFGVGMSVAAMIYTAGILTGDVAEANTRSVENRQKIEALERQSSAIARIEAKVDILMEERKR